MGLDLGDAVLYVRLMGESSTCGSSTGSTTILSGNRSGGKVNIVMLFDCKIYFVTKFATNWIRAKQCTLTVKENYTDKTLRVGVS